MNEIEKRELIEQQRKIFEAGARRADKRTGSFNFLTWSFFIAPLIASKEFFAATGKSAAPEDALAAQNGAALHAANDDPPVTDPSKTNGENATADGPAASLLAHAPQVDPIGLGAQPHEDLAKLSTARSEAVAAASGGGEDVGGGDGADCRHDDADCRHHHTHTSIDDSSVCPAPADSQLGSSQPRPLSPRAARKAL